MQCFVASAYPNFGTSSITRYNSLPETRHLRTERAEQELATRLQEYEDRRLKSNDEKQAMFAHRVKAAGLRRLAAWMKRNEPRMLAEPLVTVDVEPHLSAATGIIQLQVKCAFRGASMRASMWRQLIQSVP